MARQWPSKLGTLAAGALTKCKMNILPVHRGRALFLASSRYKRGLPSGYITKTFFTRGELGVGGPSWCDAILFHSEDMAYMSFLSRILSVRKRCIYISPQGESDSLVYHWLLFPSTVIAHCVFFVIANCILYLGVFVIWIYTWEVDPLFTLGMCVVFTRNAIILVS